MLDLSLESANSIYTYASIIAVSAACISAIAGILTYTASSVRDRYNDESIANANQVSAQANNAAAQANVVSERLIKQNLELSIQLEIEKQERLKMESSLAPRSLSDQTLKTLLEHFQHIDRATSIIVTIARQDPEVVNYSHQIIKAFQECGISTTVRNTTTMSTGSNTGVTVVLFDGPGNQTVGEAMKKAGIASTILRVPSDDTRDFGFARASIAATITIFPKAPHL